MEHSNINITIIMVNTPPELVHVPCMFTIISISYTIQSNFHKHTQTHEIAS